MQAHFALAQLHAYDGRMDRALDQYQQAYETARAGVPAAALRMEEALGVAYLHKAGMENGAHRAPGDICLFPLRPGQSYARTGDSERAIEHFLSFLKQQPDDLEVRWLLNLAYMTIGRYPDKVPPAYLIPPAAFASTEDVGRFRDVAPQAGLDVVATAGGVIVDDFAGNGRFDVVTSNFDSCGPMHYFRNNGDGTFTERTSAAGLDGQLGGLNMVQTDYNNDGCKDILVLRGGWELPQRNSLLRNNCDGTFTDVTAASGLAEPATSTQTAAWADINNDGLLDLFVGNEDRAVAVVPEQGRQGLRRHLSRCRRRSRRVHQGCERGGLRQRRIRGPLRLEFQGTATFCIGTITTTRSPRWRERQACPGPAAVLRPGSSTTTTTDGRISSRRATSRRSTNRFVPTSVLPTTPRH